VAIAVSNLLECLAGFSAEEGGGCDSSGACHGPSATTGSASTEGTVFPNDAINGAGISSTSSCFSKERASKSTVLGMLDNRALSVLGTTATSFVTLSPCSEFRNITVHRAGTIAAALALFEIATGSAACGRMGDNAAAA
jgi:hypothetical protein